MPFDLEQARKDGVSDSQIASYLAGKHGFNLAQARNEGVTDAQVIDYLMIKKTPTLLRSSSEPSVPEWGVKHPNLYGAFGAAKGVYEQVGKPTIHGLGLAGGSAVAAPSGPAGMVAGAGLGYGIATKATDIIDREIEKLEGLKKQGASVKQETINSLHNIKDGIMFEMGGQSAGALVTKGIEAVSAPYAGKMTPAAQDLRTVAKEKGITLTPAEVTGSKSLALAEALLEKVPGSTDIIRDLRVKRQLEPLLNRLTALKETGASEASINSTGRKIFEQVDDYLRTEKMLHGVALNKMRAEVLARLGTNESYLAMGLKGQELLKVQSIAARDRATAAYNKIGELLPEGITINTPRTRSIARKELGVLRNQAKQDSTLKTYLTWSADEIPPNVMEKINQLPQKMRAEIIEEVKVDYVVPRDWATLQKHSDELGALIRQEKAVPGMGFQLTPKGRIYSQLKKAVDADMRAFAKQQGGEAWEQLQAADALWGEYSGIYKSKIIKNMAAANPERIVELGFRPGSVTEIQTIKKAVGEKGFNDLRRSFTNRLLGVGKNDVFDPATFHREIVRYGDETLSEIYGKPIVAEFKKIAKDGLDLGAHRPGDAFLRAISREYPETVVDRIIGAPESKLQSNTLFKNIQVIKRVLGEDSPEFKQLGEHLLDKLFQLHQETGMVRPLTFAKMVDKYNTRVLSAFYPAAKVAELQQLARIGKTVTNAERVAGNPSGTGQTLIAWGLFKMIMNNPVTGAAVAFTPKQLAKLYISKFGMKWLTDGFRVPTSSRQAIELATKITAIVENE